MNISPPSSPKSGRLQQPSFLPSYAQQSETAQLLRPLAVLQQHQHKQPRQWVAVLQQLASKKSAVIFYMLLAIGLVWFVAAGRASPAQLTHPPIQSTVITSTGRSSSSTTTFSDPQPTFVSPSTAQKYSRGETGSGDFAVASADSSEDLPQQQHQDSITTATSTSSSSTSSSHTTGGSSATTSRSSNSTSSTGSGLQLEVRCRYGSLPGTWVSSAPTGSKWQVLDPSCQLKNWVETYAAVSHTAAAAAAMVDATGSGDGGNPTAAAAAEPSSDGSSSSRVLPYVNILLLSDSVDRYIVQHVCDYLKGVKHTIRAQHHHMQPPAHTEATPQQPQPTNSGSSTSEQSPADTAANSSSVPPAAAESGSGPSNLNATAYAFHVCQLPESVPIKLASSYFPGVHGTGPFHRGLTQNFAARINAAVAMWEEYAGGGQPPHIVSVASALWDVARLWMHERHQLEGLELPRPLLEAWMANFTAVMEYSQQQLPQTQLWLTHTTMLPAHDVTTGAMAKPYLGRRYFIEQLNAAAATVAHQLDLQLVDYAAVSSRFREGQTYLTDLIHPNAEVALEVFNLLLNLAIEPRGL